MNLRLRMVAAGEPYSLLTAIQYTGMAGPPAMRSDRVHFAEHTNAYAPLSGGRAFARGCDPGAGDDYRIYFGDRIAAGLLCASGWLRKSGDLHRRGGARMSWRLRSGRAGDF